MKAPIFTPKPLPHLLASVLLSSGSASMMQPLAAATSPVTCGGVSDTQLIQGIISNNAGKTAQLPIGRCVIKGSLHIPANTIVRGMWPTAATVLTQAAGAGDSASLIYTDGAGVTLENMELDGGRSQQTIDEHRAGIFIRHDKATIRNITSHDFTGDGFYLYNGATNASISNVTAYNNGRDGIAITGARNVSVSQSQFYGNAVDQVDVEPSKGQKVANMTFDNITVGKEGETLTGYAVVLAGRPLSEPNGQALELVLRNSTLHGAVRVVYTQNAVVSNNKITNITAKPAMEVYGFNRGARVEGNTINQLGDGYWPNAISVTGTDGADTSSGTQVKNNTIKVKTSTGTGIYLGGLLDVAVIGNTVQGPGVPYQDPQQRSGIIVRATLLNQPFIKASIIGNTIKDFWARGLSVTGNATSAGVARLNLLELKNNTFTNSAPSGVQTIGASLDDRSHALVSADCSGNRVGQGVVQPLINVPNSIKCPF
ncbi:right-handed parallel beta-helix repeat-containing protein [Candidatus Thiothrix sp. Deng01]|uniref:Right-handed parallel beta-helix repeat-containing protein n=1 Tax=Candidatus Thiothrix phosphatis TaxID=3112415 RepID=A0ABU6CUG9_9GAMM|nr:right-handed parallel beta-helix repeat-containing protein [Candidatus Thiothrix sp. Deng01]MEB4590256.1 right-handed parallel beta-helix repeat-containing protein [Candidatus Thiothrix sp. Deng01]